MSFSKVIKALRIELKISQEQLARELNISFSTINRWENGKHQPSKLAQRSFYEYCRTKGVIDKIQN